MIYVYAITDRPEAPLPRQLGLQDAELAKIVWRDIAAVESICRCFGHGDYRAGCL